MKKFFLIILALFTALISNAQNSTEILKTIADAADRNENLVGNFTEVRTPAIKEQAKVTLKGKLVFKKEGFLNMDYDNGDKFTINGSEMIISQSGKAVVLDLNKNQLMKSLSNTLMCSFKGQLSKLAEEQNADINAVKDGKDYVVTLTARKKSTRGCSKLVVRYNAADGIIRGVQIDEMTGASTTYTMD